MARSSVGQPDVTQALLKGSFTATGESEDISLAGKFNFTLFGTFVGDVVIQKSFDGGDNWVTLTALGTPITFSNPCAEELTEVEAFVKFRLNCVNYVSGTINYRVSR